MSNKHTNLQATNSDGQRLSVSETTTDSPLLPASNLQQLQQIDPTLVQWVVKQTEAEANFRRRESSKLNNYIFIERVSGVITGALVALFGLAVSGYLIYSGHDWAGAALGGATLVTIVTVLVSGKKEVTEKPTTGKQSQRRK